MEKERQKRKKTLEKVKQTILLTTLPAKRRLIFRWCESVVIVAILLTFWLLLAKEVTGAMIGVVCVFFAIFLIVGLLVSLLLRRNTTYNMTDTEIIVFSGVFEILERRLLYKDIVIYKKVVGLPDLITKNETATFKFYKIIKKRNGRKVLVQDQVCSMWGVKKHNEISKILVEKNVLKQDNQKQIRQIKKELSAEWREIKKEKKLAKKS